MAASKKPKTGSYTVKNTVSKSTDPKAALARVKSMADAAYEKFASSNPGVSRQQWSTMNKAKAAARKASGVAKSVSKPSGVAKSASKPSGSIADMAERGFQNFLKKNPGASKSDYSAYAKGRVKEMAEQGFQRFLKNNPGATRADYSAYSKGRVKDMAARARARKTGA